MQVENGGQELDHAERNLLFGWVALQAEILGLDELIKTSGQLAGDSQALLEDRLVDVGLMSREDRERVAKLCATALQSTMPKAVDVTQEFEQAAAGSGSDTPMNVASTEQAATTATPSEAPVRRERSKPPGQRYEKTRMHACGGIGRVWLAHDCVLDRDVALKELRPERRQGRSISDRFIREAKITGQLQHPAIVPVYELAGTDDDQDPFYTMRFFHGKTLHEAVDEFHPRWQSGQAGELELRDLLQAFSSVANAIAYAHSKGVIHRDLKGQNVVMGDFGEVIVLDWGIAKRLGDDVDTEYPEPGDTPGSDVGDSATLEGQVIGTPAFMAPEQAEGRIGDIDQRTDVYGLGAVLYQILTNQPPFSAEPAVALLKKVVEEPPRPPREICPLVPPALEAICLKALSKDASARYATASDLVDDVRRYVADEPVSVYPEPLLTRCGRWARRHKTAVATTAALLMTAVIALSTSTWLIAREQGRTEQQRQLALDSAQRAEASFEKALDAVDTMLTTVADERLRDIPHMEVIRRELLQEALRLNEELLEQQPDDLRGRVEVAAAYARIGKLYRNMGDIELSLERYRQAVEQYSALVAQDAKYELPQSSVLLNLASVYQLVSRYEEGEAHCRQALEMINRQVAAISGEPETEDELRALEIQAEAYRLLGSFMLATGRYADCETNYRRALASLQPLLNAEPPALRSQELAATCHNSLAVLFNRTGRSDEAQDAYEVARDAYQELVRQDPDSGYHKWNLATCQRGLARLLDAQGERERAEEVFQSALDLRQQMARDFAHIPEYRAEYAVTLNDIAVKRARAGQLKEAETYFRKAMAEDEASVAAFPTVSSLRQNLGYDYNNMGTLLLQTGRMQESLEMNIRSLKTRMALAADYPEEPLFKAAVAASHNNVGVLHQRLDQPEQASERYAEAIRIRERMVADFPDVTQYQHQLAETHRVFGSLLSSQQQFDDALAEFQQAQQIYENLPEGTVGIGQSRWRLAETHQMVGDLYADFDRPEDATSSYRRALEIRQDVLRDHAERADYQVELSVNHRVLGNHLREVEQLEEAEAELQQSIQILDKLGDQMKGNPQVDVIRASSLRGLARVEFERGDRAAARDWINQAMQLDRGAVAVAPDNGEFAASLRSDRYWEASVSIADGDLTAATRIADELAAAEPDHEDAHYQAARIHVRCLTALQDDAELSPEQRTSRINSHTSQALERLQQAVELDPNLKINRKDFQPLLDHPLFPKLLDEPKDGSSG